MRERAEWVATLPSGDLVWVKRKWDLIRNSQRKADEANNEWTAFNELLNERYRDETPDQKAKLKGANLILKDALATGAWHSANAQRHIDDVQLFIKMKEVGLL
jgi:hypothetical protein